MKHVAIVFESKFGQTEKIALHMQAFLESRGVKASLINTAKSPAVHFPADIDGVIVGSPVYVQRFRPGLLKWIEKARLFLQSRPTALFTVSLNAADRNLQARQADDELLKKFVQQSQLSPQFVASFAGALKYREYNWLMRFFLKRISARAGGDTDTSRDWEYTEWDKVNSFLTAFIDSDATSPFQTRQRFPQSAPLHSNPAGRPEFSFDQSKQKDGSKGRPAYPH